VIRFCSSHTPISPSGCRTPLRVWLTTTNPNPPPLCAPDGDMVYKGKNFLYKYHSRYAYNIINPCGHSSRPRLAKVKGSPLYMNYTNTNASGNPPPYRSC
jgi:hypothetical protein